MRSFHRDRSSSRRREDFNNRREGKFSGCYLINNAKRRQAGGPSYDRGSKLAGAAGEGARSAGIKGSPRRLPPPRLRKPKLKFGILSRELQTRFQFSPIHSSVFLDSRQSRGKKRRRRRKKRSDSYRRFLRPRRDGWAPLKERNSDDADAKKLK